jgi:multisubunit Na+/H+ antiporter MnhG subunit
MNIQVLVSLANIVSTLTVMFTLVGLIITIRQNTKSRKVLAVDSLAAAIASINVPAMAKATANRGSASREERVVAHYFLFSFFKLM